MRRYITLMLGFVTAGAALNGQETTARQALPLKDFEALWESAKLLTAHLEMAGRSIWQTN